MTADELASDLVAELQADARAAHARGMVAAPALSAVVMREAEGLPVGSARFTKVATVWADAYDDARNAELARLFPEFVGTPAGPPARYLTARLEALRAAIRAESISYGELAELQNLAKCIDPGDVELLEWAGVPEFPGDEDDDRADGTGYGNRPTGGEYDLIHDYDPETDGGHFLADPTGGGTWQPGPTPGSFHDPKVNCCGRDAADCDCTEDCERCGATFDPEQAGTTDQRSSGISLCTDCTAHNVARIAV